MTVGCDLVAGQLLRSTAQQQKFLCQNENEEEGIQDVPTVGVLENFV